MALLHGRTGIAFFGLFGFQQSTDADVAVQQWWTPCCTGTPAFFCFRPSFMLWAAPVASPQAFRNDASLVSPQYRRGCSRSAGDAGSRGFRGKLEATIAFKTFEGRGLNFLSTYFVHVIGEHGPLGDPLSMWGQFDLRLAAFPKANHHAGPKLAANSTYRPLVRSNSIRTTRSCERARQERLVQDASSTAATYNAV